VKRSCAGVTPGRGPPSCTPPEGSPTAVSAGRVPSPRLPYHPVGAQNALRRHPVGGGGNRAAAGPPAPMPLGRGGVARGPPRGGASPAPRGGGGGPGPGPPPRGAFLAEILTSPTAQAAMDGDMERAGVLLQEALKRGVQPRGLVRFVAGKTEDGSVASVQICPDATPERNWGFDVTPARLVTQLLCERGLCAASEAGILSLFPEQR